MFPDPTSKSARLFERASHVMPGGGTRHPVMFAPYMVYAANARGCHLTDVDGVERLDFVNNFSCQIHGHAHPEIVRVIEEQARRFTTAILPTELELELAELLQARVPGIERVRFCNSGTEALMIAVKAARGFTRRPQIMKMEGAYHGQYPELETSFNPGPEEWGPLSEPHRVPFSPDTPPGLREHVVIAPFNRIDITRALIRKYGDSLAAVVIDPLPSRMHFVRPSDEFLAMLREETARLGVMLVFDEVYSLRVDYHGAQGRYGVTPDLTALGKIIGGGLPIGAVGGSEQAMSVFASPGRQGLPRVFQGGTFTANPMSMAAGRRALELLTPEAYARLHAQGERLRIGLRAAANRAGLPVQVMGDGSLTGIAFTGTPFDSYRDMVAACGPNQRAMQSAFHREMLNAGVIMSTMGVFVGSTPMTDADIDATLSAAETAFRSLARQPPPV